MTFKKSAAQKTAAKAAKIAAQDQHLANREEHHNFLRGALAWRGSVSPRIFPTALVFTFYTLVLSIIDVYRYYELPHLSVAPFEYTGAVLGLVLVFRTNAGHDRWWEARKLWGGIVNQSRNLLIMVWNYGPDNQQWRNDISKWIVAFSFATKESLRSSKNFDALKDVLTEDDIADLQNAPHMPMFVTGKIAALLQQARIQHKLSMFVFLECEEQRATLIDHIGSCERILKTPMPTVYAIKTRRFIFTYLLLLPFSLVNIIGLMSPLVVFLVTYPLLSLDRIGIELQKPFFKRSLSHLPLDTICDTIKQNSIALRSKP